MNRDDPNNSAGRGGGRIVVLAMVGLAIVAATFAWWWNVGRGQRTLALYGPEAAMLIRAARTVEIFVPPGAGQRAATTSEEAPSAVTRQIDISRAPGLLNARASLLDDASFDWQQQPAPATPEDHVLIRFVEKNKQALVRIDFDSRRLSVIPEGGQATLVKKTADGWRSFIARCVQNEQPPPPQRD